jgi:hypothetical protein
MRQDTTRRSCDDDAHTEAVQLGPVGVSNPAKFKELLVNNASLLNLSICYPGSEETVFFVQNSVFHPSKPHVTLYAGPDKLGPVIGVAHLSHFSTNTIGLGDPDSNINSVVWETLSRTSNWTHSTYQFEFIFGEEGRKSFIWQRTPSNPFDDQGNMELFEDGKSDVILARYTSVGVFKWKNRGRMLIRDGYGGAWELMVLLTGLSLIELSRRRARQRRH